VDSQYGIGDPQWNQIQEYRGFDAGTNLKTTNGWYGNSNGTDLYGFVGLPGGYCGAPILFYEISRYGFWWTSTETDYYFSWRHSLCYNYQEAGRLSNNKLIGFSVRCLKDD